VFKRKRKGKTILLSGIRDWKFNLQCSVRYSSGYVTKTSSKIPFAQVTKKRL